MENNNIELIKETVKACIIGTPISVYDNDGDLCSFKLEDVICVKQAVNERRVTYIVLKNDAVCVDDNGETRYTNPVIVPGTKSKWSKKLQFKPNILNDEE